MSDAAVANIVTGIVTIAVTMFTFLTLWVKLKYNADKVEEVAKKAVVVEQKIDDNTVITRAGTQAAAVAATAAKDAATEAVTQAQTASAEKTMLLQEIQHRINGGLEAAIKAIVEPVHQSLKDHAALDESNLEEIKSILAELKRKIQVR